MARRTAMNPLPSLIRASAWDAGNASMRDAGRKAWNEDDFNAAATAQRRLVLTCYSRAADGTEDERYPWACIRFGYAEHLQRSGQFTLYSDFDEIYGLINDFIEEQSNRTPVDRAAVEQAAAERQMGLPL